MQSKDRREWGDGSLITRPNAKGGETWIAKWRIEGRSVTRSVGHRKSKVHPDGLTEGAAWAKVDRMRKSAQVNPERAKSGHSLAEVGESLKAQMRLDGLRPATVEGLDSVLRIHIVPFFGQESVAKIDADRVRAFNQVIGMKTTRSGQHLSAKSRRNILINLHQLFGHALLLGWRTAENPVAGIKKPKPLDAQNVKRHLELTEIEQLLQAVPNDVLGQAERPMYLTAARTGLRQGELFGLRWRDVDHKARMIRVEQNYVRGQFQSPKSGKARTVPMGARVRTELDRLYAATAFKGDQDLVFCHPQTGAPIDRSRVSKRFKAALKRAGVGGFEPVIDPATGQQKRKPKLDPDTNRWVRDENGVVITEPVTRPVIRFHDLRHTFATMLIDDPNYSVNDVRVWMGHADIKTTMGYVDNRDKANAAELIDATFGDVEPEIPNPEVGISDGLAANLRALTDLHTAGVLTADEFAAKAALLAAA